jgi:small subunit ribosomal protein S17
MADEEKNETTDETPEAEVPGTSAADETVDTPEEVPDTDPGDDLEPAAEAEPAADPEPAAETEPEPAVEAAPEAPAKPTRSRKHVPRSQRRTRPRPRPKREPAAKRKPITRTPKPEGDRGRRQERRGVVVSDAGDKTIVVKVDVIKSHPRYKKVVRRSVKFHAHDEQNTAGVGDTVRIVETRPLSKTKHWRLAEVVEKAK